jgi:hypothetical protein
LSSGGKEALMKAVAHDLPIFLMASFKLLRGLCQHMNLYFGNFGGVVEREREGHVGFLGTKCANQNSWVDYSEILSSLT